MTNNNKEEWVIFGIDDKYKVSSLGNVMYRVVSTPKIKDKRSESVFRGWKPKKASFRVCDKTGGGYLKTGIKTGKGVYENLYIHRIVAENFLQRCAGQDYVNHIDGNRLNNQASNLEWCTHQENITNAKNRLAFLDERSLIKRLDEIQILTLITLLNNGAGNKFLSDFYGISKASVGRARSGKFHQLESFNYLIKKNPITRRRYPYVPMEINK